MSASFPALAIIIAISVAGGDSYRLNHELDENTASRNLLKVKLNRDAVEMEEWEDVSINCTITGSYMAKDRPYISFFWMIAEDISVPLSDNIPGVTIVSHTAHRKYGRREYEDLKLRHLVNGDELNSATLRLDRRFYDILHDGQNVFSCHAYTFAGQQASAFFTVRKI